VNIDISKPVQNLEKLLDLANVSKEKISRKNRPTFVLIADDRVSRMKPQVFNENFDKFQQILEKETK
jgi:predicted transcriptional regulator